MWIKRVKNWALACWIATFGLIMIGSFVRASGSGMGCPDWPTCFGQWIPPTHISQLPPDYATRYAHLGTIVFNPIHTWIEYVNRLAGVSVGLLAIGLAIVSTLARRHTSKWVMPFSWAIVGLIGYQGWVGAKVVSSVLAPYMISIHMVLATWIVVMQGIVLGLTSPYLGGGATSAYRLFSVAAIIQWGLGIRIRQGVDHGVAVQSLGDVLIFHIILGLLLSMAGYLWGKEMGNRPLKWALYAMLVAQLGSGGVFYWLGLTKWLQPIHLLGGIMSIGLIAYWAVITRTSGSQTPA